MLLLMQHCKCEGIHKQLKLNEKFYFHIAKFELIICSNRKMKIKNVPIVIIETLTSKFVSLLSGMNISTRVEPIKFPSRKIQGRELKKASARERLKMYSISFIKIIGNQPRGR